MVPVIVRYGKFDGFNHAGQFDTCPCQDCDLSNVGFSVPLCFALEAHPKANAAEGLATSYAQYMSHVRKN